MTPSDEADSGVASQSGNRAMSAHSTAREITDELAGIQRRFAEAERLEATQLVELVRDDQRLRWERGEQITAEKYFERFPALLAETECAVDLIYGEFLLRAEFGEAVRPAEYLERFPRFADELRRQFKLRDALEALPSRTNSLAPELQAPQYDAAATPRFALSSDDGSALDFDTLPARVGRFEVKRQLGAGGFSRVFRAYDPQLGRDVALKVPHSHLVTAEHRERFLREARAAGQVQHPNLISVYDAGLAAEGCYIAYQLVEGQTLREVIQQRALQAEEAADLVRKLAQAAHHAHTKGIFHRDLKTGNVLIDCHGAPYISDFGLARLEGDSTLTADAAVLGTPAYMSPEQAAGASHQADARSDVYSLGVILYELLCERLPFVGPPQSVLRNVLDAEPPHLRSLKAGIPRDLETICLKAMAKRPVERYASAQHLADDLARWLRGEPIQARPSGTWERAVKWARRRPAAAALVAVVAASLVIVAGGSLWYSARLSSAMDQTAAALERSQELLSRSQAARGVQLLDDGNTLGLLHLLEACRTARDMPRSLDSRRLIWATWYPLYGGRLQQVVGHDDRVTVAQFSPDGKLVVTASRAGAAQLWNLATGQPVGRALPCSPSVSPGRLAFSPDGRLLATSDGKVVYLFDTRTGEPGGPTLDHESTLGRLHLEFSPDGKWLAVAMSETSEGQPPGVVVWQTDGWQCRCYLPVPEGAHYFAFSPDSGLFAAISLTQIDPKVRIWNTGSWDVLQTSPPRHELPILAIAFSADGRLLASASQDHTARLWDLETGEPRGEPMRHGDDVLTVAFSPDGTRLITGSFDGTARLWNAATAESASHPLRHQAAVRTVRFSPDSQLVATGSADGTARLWRLADGRPYGPPFEHAQEVTTLAFHPNGESLLTASGSAARVWKVAASTVSGPILRHDGRVYDLAFSPDSKMLVTGTDLPGSVWLWDSHTGEVIAEPHRVPGGVYAVGFSGEGRWIAAASAEKSGINFWNADRDEFSDAAEIRDLPWARVIRNIAFSPSGNLLAFASSEFHAAAICRIPAGTLDRGPLRHDDEVWGVAFSPDGKLLASGSHDRTVRVWDAATGELQRELPHEEAVEKVAFSPDGRRLAAAMPSRGVRLWDTVTWQSPGNALEKRVQVEALAFHSSGKLLATASKEGLVRVWDITTGLPCGPAMRHDGFATCVAFSPDGQWLASGSFDQTVRLWPLPPLGEQLGVEELERRTWAALGMRLGPEGFAEPIPWDDWQWLRQHSDSH